MESDTWDPEPENEHYYMPYVHEHFHKIESATAVHHKVKLIA